MKEFLSAIKPEYILIIGASLIIIISFVFNFVSKKTNVPSVLLLLVLGIVIQFIFPNLKDNPLISKSLIIVGKVGIILIVLEAALDLKIKRKKIGLILKSLGVAIFGLFVSAFVIAYFIQLFLEVDFYRALIYAVPLSIMSSSIIIPSVTALPEDKKEFMIYESTFSDIIGIVFFQFLTAPKSYGSAMNVFWEVSANIGITIIVAVLFSYFVVWGFSKIKSPVKLFLIISVLVLAYAIGSVFHLSSLIIVLLFGVILNNVNVFFRGPLQKYINADELKPVVHEFHIITLESAFFLRTFFFVMFGLTITLMSLLDTFVALQSLIFVVLLYVVRAIFLKIMLWDKSIIPELWIAPRGLITILLFYTIPVSFQIEEFSQGVLLYAILITSVIMTFALIKAKGENITDVLLRDRNLNYLEDGVEKEILEEEIKYHESELKEDRDIQKEEDKSATM